MAKRVEKTLPPIIRLLDHVKAGDGAVTQTVGLSRIYTALGSQPLTNEKLSEMFPEYSDADILRRTGITSRPALGKDENVLTLAIAAAKKALHEEQMSIRDIDAIICSTTTPMSVTPALSCRVLDALNDRENPHEVPAYDISAACAGYLYSLANGFDFLNVELGGTVLVLTSEAMTEISSREDFDTAILFGDAASATILRGPAHERPSAYQLHRPLITALGESGAMLGATDEGYLKMDGRKVFAEAVRHMADILDRVCVQTGVDYEDLDQIVPHQANGRIIDAIRRRLGVDAERMFNNISQLGNTSSSSIPLALADMMDQQIHGTIGLTAFGAGFTLGAAILSHPNEEVIRRRVA
jgi:2-oxoisovalerate dehydrogenase E1 component